MKPLARALETYIWAKDNKFFKYIDSKTYACFKESVYYGLERLIINPLEDLMTPINLEIEDRLNE